MLNISSKRLLTVNLSIIIIIIVTIGSIAVVNQYYGSYPKQNSFDSKTLDNYLNALQGSKYSSQSVASVNATQNGLWIIHYSDSKTKMSLLDKLSQLNIAVLSILNTLPFIIANMTQEQVNNLQTLFPNSIQFTKNNEWQAFPKPDTSNLTAQSTQVPSNYQSPREIIQANQLGNTTLGQGTKIAIIDTGIDYTHPAFLLPNGTSRIVFNESFVNPTNGYSTTESILDKNGHGTHVAGIAAGGGSGIFTGIAPEASLVILKVGDALGFITTVGILEAIDVAIQQRVDVISLSIGTAYSNPDDPMSLALDTAVAHGISVTVSAGNSGPNLGTIGTPASSRLAISVGASQANVTVTSFSSRGPTSDNRINPDVVAPGDNIIAPLSSGSLFDLSSSYFVPSLAINGNYISLSGTSMATPVVAGSIALLKQLYPNLSPMAFRSALMSSATSLNLPANVQGAGLVNVYRASQFLAANMSKTTDSISNTTAILPEQNILSNFHIPQIIFPNDNFSMRLFIVSGANITVNMQILNNTFSKVFMLTSERIYSFNTTMGYYREFLLTLAPGATPQLGFYNGSLEISINTNKGINMTIYVGSFEIVAPRESILWPLLHTDSSTDPNSLTSNFYNFSNYLRTKNISITTTNSYLSTNLLSSYNAVIIDSPLTPFMPDELQSLNTFVTNGGHVIILGTYSSFFDFTNINNFLSAYGAEFLGNSPILLQDLGIGQNIISPNTSSLLLNQGSPLLANVNSLPWFYGSLLNIINTTSIITLGGVQTSNNQAGLAYFPGNNSIHGSILISGEDELFTNQNFASSSSLSSVAIFVNNLINDFFNYSSTQLTVFSPTTTISAGLNLTFGVALWNKTVLTKNPTTNVNITIVNGTSTSYTKAIFNSALDYFVSNITFSSPGLYQLTFEYPSLSVSRAIMVHSSQVTWNLTFKTNGSVNPNQLPNYLSNADIGSTVLLGQQATFSFTTTSASSFQPILIISDIPIVFYDIASYYQNLSEITNIVLGNPIFDNYNNVWTFTYTFSTSLPTGVYYVEVYQNLTSTETLGATSSYDGIFYVIDTQPLIDLSKSTINGNNPLSNYAILSSSQNPLILQPSLGSNVSLTLVAGQHGHSPLKVVVVVAPYYPFLEFNLEFSVTYLSSVNSTYFTGNVQMPTRTLYSLVGSTYNFTIAGKLLVLYILLFDQYGNYDAFPVFVILNQNSSAGPFSNILAPLIVGFLFLGVFFFYLIYRSSRKKSSKDYYYQYFPQQPMNQNQYGSQINQQPPLQGQPPSSPTIKFCPHCGAPVIPGANFCMECGKKIL